VVTSRIAVQISVALGAVKVTAYYPTYISVLVTARRVIFLSVSHAQINRLSVTLSLMIT
jgi:hypothetical protein